MTSLSTLPALARAVAFLALTLALLSAVAFATTFVALLLKSPGRPRPYADETGRVFPDSVSEKGTVTIRGADLGFFLKGRDTNNPILLYLHGGMPDYFMTERYPTGLDTLFTVAWLDLRGAGRSYDPKRDVGSVSVEEWIADAVEFTDFLRKRFGQERIYLMGHSGGTYLGIKLIEAYPEAYAAYIGVAQIARQKLSEKLAYDYIVDKYAGRPDRRKVYRSLTSEPVTLDAPLPNYYLRYRDYAMHDLGVGTMRGMKRVVTGLFLPSLLFTEYTLAEKIRLWRAKARSGVSATWDAMLRSDLADESHSFKVPVFFLHGEHDYTCSFILAKDYLERIEAPAKGFFALKGSAHSPIFEEPEECLRIIREIILPAP